MPFCQGYNIEKNLGHPTYFCKDLNELEDYNKKIDEEESKGNCCIVVENINFFMEECGVELVQENDSVYSMDSFYPTIINVDENKYKVLKSVV